MKARKIRTMDREGNVIDVMGLKGERGSPGETGPAGPRGESGADGKTPHIGENGNWFIGDTDTGVPAGGEGGASGVITETDPTVFAWAKSHLPFTTDQLSDMASGAGFYENPTNFADGKTYFRYHAGATSFTWTNPNQQTGAVTITVLAWSQWGDKTAANQFSRLVIVYGDGSTKYLRLTNGQTVSMTTDANKVLAEIRGNYDHENWVLLDMSVLTIVADYPAPTGTSAEVMTGASATAAGKAGLVPAPEAGDEGKFLAGDGTWKTPESSGGGTDLSLGVTGATVGQTVRITAVDDEGKPTAWEAVDGEKEWKLLRNITLPEDPSTDTSGIEWTMCVTDGYTGEIASFAFSTDENGETFAVRELLIFANHAYGKEANYFGIADQDGQLGYGNLFCNRSVFGDKSALTPMVIHVETFGTYVYTTLHEVDNYTGNGVLWSNYTKAGQGRNEEDITTVKLGTFVDASIMPGASYEIWGR